MNLYQIFSGFSIATTLVVTISIFNTSAIASEIQQTVNSGIYPREPNFFSEGRKEFDTEVQLLLHKINSPPETILKISSEQQNIEKQLAPVEKPANSQNLPSQN